MHSTTRSFPPATLRWRVYRASQRKVLRAHADLCAITPTTAPAAAMRPVARWHAWSLASIPLLLWARRSIPAGSR